MSMPPPVILASASPTRRRILEQAGITVEIVPAHIDENAIRDAVRADGGSARDGALVLAETKARRVCPAHPGGLVIGADQILDCRGRWFDKPGDMDHAESQLRALRGLSHELATAVVIVRDGQRIWHHLESPRLTMRPFSDEFLKHYLTEVGEAALGSVGGYQLEGRGAQLFSRIEGDFFSILGLPLLPVLDFLRGHGVVMT